LGAKNPCIFVFMRDTGRFAYVYIMANDWRVLDVGVTSTLEQRVQQHKEERFVHSFTARYHLHKLVYFERFSTIPVAIAREKQIKGWRRVRKIELIVKENPDWKDLSADSGKPIESFHAK
jgi:putative endonuclease